HAVRRLRRDAPAHARGGHRAAGPRLSIARRAARRRMTIRHYSRELAAWAAELSPAVVPADAKATARTLVMDAIGCALSGTLASAGCIALDYARSQGGVAEATLIGTATKVPAGNAAFANTMTGRIDLFDDCDSIAHIHAGVATI